MLIGQYLQERLDADWSILQERSMLIGQYLQERLDADWLTVTYLMLILFTRVNVKKRGSKVEEDDLAEYSNSFSLMSAVMIYFASLLSPGCGRLLPQFNPPWPLRK